MKDAYFPTMTIKLVTTPLTPEQARTWYQIVKKYAPSGILTDMQVPGKDGELASSVMVKRVDGNLAIYDIPVTRFVLDEELEPIARKWDELFPEFDFEISSIPNDEEVVIFQRDEN